MRPNRLLFAICSVAVSVSFAAGCSSSEGEAEGEGEPRVPRQVTVLTADLPPVVEGNNEFAWAMYDQLRTDPGNVFFSPFSISAALGMTYAGAANATAAQMQAALKIKDPASFHQAFGALIVDLSGEKPGRGYQLFIANRLFGQTGFEFAQPFLDLTQQHYGAGLERLDFASNADGARQQINTWVSDQTRDKIPDLLAPGTVDSLTRLVLANAIYFKADWASPFNVSATQDRPFTLRDGSQVQVPTMARKGGWSSARGNGFDVLELAYKDREVSMVLLIPHQGVTFDATEEQIVAQGIDAFRDGMTPGEGMLQLPKFEFHDKNPLTAPLKAMGMIDAFDPGVADLSGIAPGAAGDRLFIQSIVHEAYVKVDEKGTEAAASTAVGAGVVSRPLDFFVDRAFVFVIRDRLTGSILFMGRVDDPRVTS